jgi:general stress protein 26
MEVTTFEDLRADFMRRVSSAVYCSMATVDSAGRPRSRILHPIWDGPDAPIGWVISWPESHKAKHLRANPYVSLAYIQDKDKPVYVDCHAEWINDEDEQRRIWALHKSTPPPLGFDPEPHYGDIHHRYFGLLRFTPWRIELGNLQGEPIIWRPA